MEEQYKLIGGGYEVSNKGNMRYEGQPFEPYKLKYKQVIIDNKMLYLHHLVAQHFIGDRPEPLQLPNGKVSKYVVDHIDRDKYNNDVTNLRYVTQQKNSCNKAGYRTDIEEEDPIKRRNIIAKQSQKKRWDNNPEYKAQKKAYYEANRETILAKAKAKYVSKKGWDKKTMLG